MPAADDPVLRDFLDPATSLAQLAQRHSLSLEALTDWLRSPETQAALARSARLARARMQAITLAHAPDAMAALARRAADDDDPAEQRRAATAFLRAAACIPLPDDDHDPDSPDNTELLLRLLNAELPDDGRPFPSLSNFDPEPSPKPTPKPSASPPPPSELPQRNRALTPPQAPPRVTPPVRAAPAPPASPQPAAFIPTPRTAFIPPHRTATVPPPRAITEDLNPPRTIARSYLPRRVASTPGYTPASTIISRAGAFTQRHPP